MNSKTRPQTRLAKVAARALKRAGLRARKEARRYGTSIHIQTSGTIVALKP